MKTSKIQAPKAPKAPSAIINVMQAAGVIVTAYATFADARDAANASAKTAWGTSAEQFRAAGKKQCEALRTTTIAEALRTWGDSASGKTKTLTTAVNIAARAVKLSVPMFGDDGKVLSREKVRTAVSIAEKAQGAGNGEAPAAVESDGKAGTVNVLSAENVENVLHYLSVPDQAAPFGPSILKAAEAAGFRVMTAAEQTALSAYYLQVQKAA